MNSSAPLQRGPGEQALLGLHYVCWQWERFQKAWDARDIGLPGWVDAQRVFPQFHTSLWGLGIFEPSESESTELLGQSVEATTALQHHTASLPLHCKRLGQMTIFPYKNLMGEAGRVFGGSGGGVF